MNPRATSSRRQRGVSIIAAIFFLLLFAAIAAAMVSLTTTSNTTSTLDVQGSRAYQAARGGVEWGLWQVANNPANGPPATAASPLPSCFASPTNLAILGFAVAVTCEVFPGAGDFQEGTKNLRLFRIIATATGAGPGGGVSRRLTVTVEVCRDSASTVAPFDCTF